MRIISTRLPSESAGHFVVARATRALLVATPGNTLHGADISTAAAEARFNHPRPELPDSLLLDLEALRAHTLLALTVNRGWSWSWSWPGQDKSMHAAADFWEQRYASSDRV